MTKTFKELQEADQVVAGMYAKNDKLRGSKFGWAWKRFTAKNSDSIIKELNEKLDDNRIELCLTDKETKEILYNEKGGYKFTKEALKSLLEANRELVDEYEKKDIEIIPFIVKSEDLPEMTEEEIGILTGLII